MQLAKSVIPVVFVWGCCIPFQPTAAFNVHDFKVSITVPLGEATFSNTVHVPLDVYTLNRKGVSVADMQRGTGGRIENAFASAKERGEAAFVAFVTAGYPRREGTSLLIRYQTFFRSWLGHCSCA